MLVFCACRFHDIFRRFGLVGKPLLFNRVRLVPFRWFVRFICVGLHALVAGLNLVCGDHVEGGLRKVWFEFMSSIIHHLIGGGFSVLIDSYCSSWSCFWYVCMFSFTCSRSRRVVVLQRWIKGWRGLVSVHGWFDSLRVIFIWSDLLESGVELLINLELRDCLDDIIPSRFSFFICTVLPL